jgi:DNA-binding FadR family transcriptional regulator
VEFKRIGQVTICEKVINYFQTMIINKSLEAGAKLPSEFSLAEQMGVGRGTIREALQVLIYLGYLERRGNGTYVADFSSSNNPAAGLSENILKYRNTIEMIEIRKSLEPEVAALAAKKAYKKSLVKLEEQVKMMEKFSGDLDKFIEHDSKFHILMIAAIKNNLLEEIIKNIYALMKESVAVILKEGSIEKRSMDFHRKILSALQEGESELARNYMLNHIIDIEEEMYDIMSRRNK